MGVKRKIDEIEEIENYGGQRQSVLNISMCKLQTHSIKRVEPSLLRSVLILNTLKHIETELKKEGICSNLPEASLTLHDEADDISVDILPDNIDGSEFIEQDLSDLHINVDSSSHSTNADVEAFTPSKDSESSPLPPIETFVELSSAVNTFQNSNIESGSLKVVTSGDSYKSAMKSDMDTSSKELCSPLFTQQTSLPFKVEDLFGDIDISHCDFDIFSSLSSSIKLTPLSADEVLHSFPVHSAGISESYASLLSSSFPSTCKSDFLPEEIDNIMQILVGT